MNPKVFARLIFWVAPSADPDEDLALIKKIKQYGGSLMPDAPDDVPEHLFLLILVDTIATLCSIRSSAIHEPFNPNKLDSIIAKFGTKREHIDSEQVVILIRDWVEKSVEDKTGQITGPGWLGCRVTGKERVMGMKRSVEDDDDDDPQYTGIRTGASTALFGHCHRRHRQSATEIPSSSSARNEVSIPNTGQPIPIPTPLSSTEPPAATLNHGAPQFSSAAGFFGNASHIQYGQAASYGPHPATGSEPAEAPKKFLESRILQKMCGVNEPTIYVVGDWYGYMSKDIRAAGGITTEKAEAATILVFPCPLLYNESDVSVFHAALPHQTKVAFGWFKYSMISQECQPLSEFPVSVSAPSLSC